MNKPPRLCALCGKVHSLAQRCPQQLERERQRKARHDLNRPSARERGYDAKWEKARRLFLREHPLCQCGAEATTVDHRIPHRGDRQLFWNRANWQPLCTHCHSSTKQRLEHAL